MQSDRKVRCIYKIKDRDGVGEKALDGEIIMCMIEWGVMETMDI